MNSKISRRKFLGQASCAAIGSTTLLSSLMSLSSINALAQSSAESDDYKALVCILLSGGCDSFNLVVPRGDGYNDYAQTRGNVALAENSLLPIDALNSNGRLFGVHPNLSAFQNLFNKGNAAILSGVGTLVHPIVDVADYKQNKFKVPQGLYSHSDQIQQWQTSVPQDRNVAKGWGGRIADIMHTVNENPNISMNISLAGRNVFQAGDKVIEYAIKSSGIEGIHDITGGRRGLLNRIRDNAMNDLLTEQYHSVFESTYAGMTKNTLDAFADFAHAVDKVEPFTTQFSDTNLSEQLQMVAKVMAARNELRMSRQTFFINYGGWDHHSNLIANQERMLQVLDNAIGEFNSVLEELNLQDKVTTFTISDFARTMTSNNTGTDHAWGGNSLIVGGAVNGKRIYGTYPELYLKDNPLLTSGRGNMIPQVSTDSYFAELALWFGLPPGSLSDVLPNIGNFYTHQQGNMPIGFINV